MEEENAITTTELTDVANKYLKQISQIRREIVAAIPEVAEKARRRGKSAQTLVLYEAEDRTISILEKVATEMGMEVGVLLFDEIFVHTHNRSGDEIENLRRQASEAATATWGTPITFTASPVV